MTKALPKQDILVEVVDGETGIFIWLSNPTVCIHSISKIRGVHHANVSGKSLIMVGTDSRFDIEEVAQEIRDLLESLFDRTAFP